MASPYDAGLTLAATIPARATIATVGGSQAQPGGSAHGAPVNLTRFAWLAIAAAVATILLAISLAVIVLLDVLQRRVAARG